MPLVRCSCKVHNCNGRLVNPDTAYAHRRSDLRSNTIQAQAQLQRATQTKRIIPSAQPDVGPVSRSLPNPVHPPTPPLLPHGEFHDPPALSDCEVEQEMLDHGSLTQEDLDITTFGSALPNLGPNFHSPEALIAAIDHFSIYNEAVSAGARPLTTYQAHNLPVDPDSRAFEQEMNRIMDNARAELNADTPPPDEVQEVPDEIDEDDLEGTYEVEPDEDAHGIHSTSDEDNPDPFTVDDKFHLDNIDLSHVPHHLLSIYAVISWLHLQYHLPRVACNALLALLGCIILAIAPSIATPVITIQSSNRVLGIDKPILLLPVCPSCLEVYPSAGSRHCQDNCTNCNIPLFKSNLTARGNIRAKTPVLKYPYLPLSTQIRSILKIPGLEALLDEWRYKPRTDGMYTDVFDGDICRRHLKGPDGRLFFSNLTHEKNGPNGELRIGVNLGVDWYAHYY